MSLNELPPAQRFMYEYGCFAAFWSNFDLMMEVAICDLSGRQAMENCRQVNPLTAGRKRQMLTDLLNARNEAAKLAALNKVFDVAERNNWIHGHILNPNGDFSKLTRLRVTINGASMTVSNFEISQNVSPFADFYTEWGEIESVFGLSKNRCNQYITDIQR